MNIHSRRLKTAAGIAGLLMVAAPLAACGSSNSSSSSSGSAATAVASLPDLSHGVSTSVKLDSGFTGALKSLGLTPGVSGTAKLTSDGSLVFPITGGSVQVFTPGTVPQYVTGQIQHEGSGLTLSAGGTTVTIGNFNIDPGFGVVYGDVSAGGKTVVSSTPIFYLDGSTLQPIGAANAQGEVTLQGTTVYLTSGAAKLLDSTFGTDKVAGGLKIGIATVLVGTK